ncbi:MULTISPECIES: phosphotransferase [unclassified Streptomyces]|uniref:aminoglycoside phosphotransferase family protein n=1 Tax=unclassified Streptomyces TaxID=2593676 RepID=UPI001368B6CC|nr:MULTISPECIES: phosphotransferase [unclassified Streptomyces]NDZ99000.1 phosphotransferase [Streptomyces sp. SID10116]MYY85020.1 phosphotransferase [Streptomyces sp. SID335]MYZ14349.1 phosphotransferase [Streptomyces sp. SID337]NDZ85931.1 phosphotransferase [Streptomyces sp. SID10115]NEB49407.1 phosphotransferase [Streptomyces sp. SID339]
MLPEVNTDEEWDRVVPDDTIVRPGAEDLCARLGFAGAGLTRYPAGSQPVYAVGDSHVLKLFPGMDAQDAVTEARVLRHVDGRLPVPTPRVHGEGTYDNGWRYVLMSRLPGEDLAVAWARIPRADRERVVTDAAEALAALHALDPAPLADVLGPGDWGAFTAGQRAGAVDRQRRCELPDGWLEQIPGFLDSVPLPDAGSVRPALLHTEFMRQHLTVDPADGWRLTGLLDFEPAMIGDPAYDFVGVGLFVTRAEPGLLARFMKAYGRSFEPRVLLAYTLLHVYSNLPWYLRELPAPPEPTLDALAETWFGQ